MYIRGISMAIDNCIKPLNLINIFIVSKQKLNLTLKDYSLNSHFFRVYSSLSALFEVGIPGAQIFIYILGIKTWPPKIYILIYYTSCEFPIQNFHRRTTDIL